MTASTLRARWTFGMEPGAAKALSILVLALVSAVLAASAAQAQTYKVLYSFTGGDDGKTPESSLMADAAGNLYGTTMFGGAYGYGVAFKLDATGKETVLHAFTGGADGAYSVGGLILDEAGNLYGTTEEGGDLGCNVGHGCGIVFKLDPSGTEAVLYSFTDGTDGGYPSGPVLRDGAGNLYGTTSYGGGGCECGVVFKLGTGGTETALHTFTGGSDGAYPLAGLVRGAAGNLYSTTYLGGTYGKGTVFGLDITGNEVLLYSFTGGSDGGYPNAGLTLATTGNLYGTTEEGGDLACPSGYGCGTVYKVDASGKETVLYSFTGGTEGSEPLGGLVIDPTGSLYGTTIAGGAPQLGVVFGLNLAERETVLYTFSRGADGAAPFASLIHDAAGNFYGTAAYGGIGNNGTVFEITRK